mmetsp:Transcript_103314/g.333253  ORF Transcript_103314/g.333253 Transcript_103314/m.333253 type:complete len:239 (-) Transcript_103314:333-1049(-)
MGSGSVTEHSEFLGLLQELLESSAAAALHRGCLLPALGVDALHEGLEQGPALRLAGHRGEAWIVEQLRQPRLVAVESLHALLQEQLLEVAKGFPFLGRPLLLDLALTALSPGLRRARCGHRARGSLGLTRHGSLGWRCALCGCCSPGDAQDPVQLGHVPLDVLGALPRGPPGLLVEEVGETVLGLHPQPTRAADCLPGLWLADLRLDTLGCCSLAGWSCGLARSLQDHVPWLQRPHPA